MTDIEKAEYGDVIRQLTERLRETVDENDRLRAELARQTEGASAYATLSDIHRNRDLPAAVRAKAAIGCLPHEMPKLLPERAPLELIAEPPEQLAAQVARQRARMNQMHTLSIDQRSELITGVSGNGSDDSDD